MNFFKKMFGTKESEFKITVEEIRDFYRYSEIAKWKGNMSNAKNPFGSCIEIDSTRENGQYIYNGIWIFGDKKWAYISVKNESVQIRYLETDYMPAADACPVIADLTKIASITKAFFYWYGNLNLPRAIEDMRKHVEAGDSVSVVKEIKIKAFGDEAVLRVMSDKKTLLIFNFFPPGKGYLTKQQADNFEKILSDAIGKKVIHDDRELFVIFNNSQKMVGSVITFLQSFERK